MQSYSSPKAVVMLIDDEVEITSNLSSVLGGAGYICHACHDGPSARAMAAQISPDLIISDINLAGHSGLALCEDLKHQPHLEDVPLMFLSGAQIPDIIRRSHEAGGTYYLRKPYDPSVLLELVDKALWMPHLVGGRRATAATA